MLGCSSSQEALKDKESPNRKFFFMGDEYQPHGYKARLLGCSEVANPANPVDVGVLIIHVDG